MIVFNPKQHESITFMLFLDSWRDGDEEAEWDSDDFEEKWLPHYYNRLKKYFPEKVGIKKWNNNWCCFYGPYNIAPMTKVKALELLRYLKEKYA